ncbi:MAG: hypothetical protein EOO14_17220, partial [Chitinophagaceae bacterium]
MQHRFSKTNRRNRHYFPAALVLLLLANIAPAQKQYPTVGYIERLDSAINAIVSPGAKAEVIATGFDWSEGPLWIEKQQALL